MVGGTEGGRRSEAERQISLRSRSRRGRMVAAYMTFRLSLYVCVFGRGKKGGGGGRFGLGWADLSRTLLVSSRLVSSRAQTDQRREVQLAYGPAFALYLAAAPIYRPDATEILASGLDGRWWHLL